MVEKHKNLSNEKRLELFQYLLAQSSNDTLPRGTLKLAMEKFACSRATIARIWKRGITKAEGSTGYSNVDSLIKNKCGAKKKYSAEMVQEAIKNVPEDKRTSLRDIANYTGISKSTCHRFLKLGHLQAHSSTVDLSKEHKKLTKNAPDVHVFFTQDVHAERKPKGARYASKCNFCFNHTSSNAICRLEMHLRNCTHAPDDIKKQYPHPNTRINVINYSIPPPQEKNMSSTPLKRKKRVINRMCKAIATRSTGNQSSISDAISNLWYTHALPFKTLDSPEFLYLMNELCPSYKPLSAEVMGHSQLDVAYTELKKVLQSVIDVDQEITLISYGWSTLFHDANISYVLFVKNRPPIFYMSSTVSHGDINGVLIATQIGHVLEEIGLDKVVSVLTDFNPHMKDAWSIIEKRYLGIFCNAFATQTMSFLMKDIINLDVFEETVENALFLANYVKRDPFLGKYFSFELERRQIIGNSLPDRKIRIPVENRWATYCTFVNDLLENKSFITEMCNIEYSNIAQHCQEDGRTTRKLDKFKDLLHNIDFWDTLLELNIMLHPIANLLSSFETRDCYLSDVFNEFKEYMENLPSDTNIYNVCYKKWCFLNTESLCWTYLLHPNFVSMKDVSPENTSEYIKTLHRHLISLEIKRTGGCTEAKRSELMKELQDFLAFSATTTENFINPVQYWNSIGLHQYPHLFKVAVRLFCIPTSNSVYERLLLQSKIVQSKFEFHGDRSSFEKLIFVHYNSILQQEDYCDMESFDDSLISNSSTFLL